MSFCPCWSATRIPARLISVGHGSSIWELKTAFCLVRPTLTREFQLNKLDIPVLRRDLGGIKVGSSTWDR
eukprot:323-Pelagomonas_calceolata.AAC.1